MSHYQTADHDFHPHAKVTPVGIFLPVSDELFLYGVTSKVTSDCLVDRLSDWWETVKERFSHITTLLINLDNGPENQSRRTEVSCSVWWNLCNAIISRFAYTTAALK